MRTAITVVAIAMLAACNSGAGPGDTGVSAVSSATEAAPPVLDDRAPVAVPESAAPAMGQELVNPDGVSVVFLYHALAGLTPSIDNWVEEDGRVRYAAAIDKAAKRAALRTELLAAAESVKGVGALRLSMNADLSDYDPSYGEFTVRALAPSSMVTFDAFAQKVSVSFRNGRTAQIWKVPPAQAQAVRDRIGYAGNIELDVLLRIVKVLPGAGGGTIVTEVVEYEMRDRQRGLIIGRVQVVG